MKSEAQKNVSIKWLFIQNIVLFIAFYLTIYLMDSKLNIGYIFVVLATLSIFEAIFFYRLNDKSFRPISYDKSIQCVLLAIGSTVVLIGSILFILVLFKIL